MPVIGHVLNAPGIKVVWLIILSLSNHVLSLDMSDHAQNPIAIIFMLPRVEYELTHDIYNVVCKQPIACNSVFHCKYIVFGHEGLL